MKHTIDVLITVYGLLRHITEMRRVFGTREPLNSDRSLPRISCVKW